MKIINIIITKLFYTNHVYNMDNQAGEIHIPPSKQGYFTLKKLNNLL